MSQPTRFAKGVTGGFGEVDGDRDPLVFHNLVWICKR
jgi:hypothetical protein